MRRGRLRNDVYIDFISDICAASSAQVKLGVYGCGTCFLLVMQHFHRIKGQRFQEARKRFLDVSLYIDTLLYSF